MAKHLLVDHEEITRAELNRPLTTIYSLAIRSKVIVEIGVGEEGRSTEVLLNACKDGVGHLWSVDKDHLRTRGIVLTYKESDLNQYWTFVLADLFDFAKEFDKKIDLFYMDTDDPAYIKKYSRPAYIPDFQFLALEAFAPLMAEDGIMVIHNTKVFPLTREGCIKFIKANPKWHCSFLSLCSDYGLAALVKK